MKRKLVKISKAIGIVLVVLYAALCVHFYFTQEMKYFQYSKLAADYKFDFKGNFEQINHYGLQVHSFRLVTESHPNGYFSMMKLSPEPSFGFL